MGKTDDKVYWTEVVESTIASFGEVLLVCDTKST